MGLSLDVLLWRNAKRYPKTQFKMNQQPLSPQIRQSFDPRGQGEISEFAEQE